MSLVIRSVPEKWTDVSIAELIHFMQFPFMKFCVMKF